MQARFSSKKLIKTIELINAALKKKFISMNELQSLSDFLAFATKIMIFGKVFLKRLYNALGAKYFKIRMSSSIKADLRGGRNFLPKWNGIRILHKNRPISKMGIDASGKYDMSGYILYESDDINNFSSSRQVFSKKISIKHKKKHINFKKMMAILHALKRFELNAADHRVLMHCDNFAIIEGLKKSSIKGDAMMFLRVIVMKLVLLDLDIVIKFI